MSTYYTFDPNTHEFLNVRVPQIDPLESEIAGETVYTLPGQYETIIEPPTVGIKEKAIFNNGVWEIVEDHRGETWWINHSQQIVIEQLGNPLDFNYYQTQPPKTYDSITEAQEEKINFCWNKMIELTETDYVAITTSAGKHNYGIDKTTRDNIQMALIGVLAGIVTGPKSWSPKGEVIPIELTPQEIGLVAGTIGNSYETYIQAYFVHKAAIKQLQTTEEVINYDFTTNWPSLPK